MKLNKGILSTLLGASFFPLHRYLLNGDLATAIILAAVAYNEHGDWSFSKREAL
ncbi:hypothetical protein [Cytobacillus firmus]|uniref:hypothetical protein n=1 Tax=Cytobacillus firmus TaxID=1399 RepID=UPI0022282AF8|nr:hypothetical protein [Cytobacillus firmus]